LHLWNLPEKVALAHFAVMDKLCQYTPQFAVLLAHFVIDDKCHRRILSQTTQRKDAHGMKFELAY